MTAIGEPALFIETPDRGTSVFGTADYCGPTGTGDALRVSVRGHQRHRRRALQALERRQRPDVERSRRTAGHTAPGRRYSRPPDLLGLLRRSGIGPPGLLRDRVAPGERRRVRRAHPRVALLRPERRRRPLVLPRSADHPAGGGLRPLAPDRRRAHRPQRLHRARPSRTPGRRAAAVPGQPHRARRRRPLLQSVRLQLYRDGVPGRPLQRGPTRGRVGRMDHPRSGADDAGNLRAHAGRARRGPAADGDARLQRRAATRSP